MQLRMELTKIDTYYRNQIETNNRLNKELKEVVKNYQGKGLEILQGFEEELTSMFECPLTLCDIKVPAILPSGHTIEKSFMEKLVKDRRKDPFNNTSKLYGVVINRFAVKIREVLTKVRKIITSFHDFEGI